METLTKVKNRKSRTVFSIRGFLAESGLVEIRILDVLIRMLINQGRLIIR